jgi:hypothetical protein
MGTIFPETAGSGTTLITFGSAEEVLTSAACMESSLPETVGFLRTCLLEVSSGTAEEALTVDAGTVLPEASGSDADLHELSVGTTGEGTVTGACLRTILLDSAGSDTGLLVLTFSTGEKVVSKAA